MFNVGSVQGYLKLNMSGWTRSMSTVQGSLRSLSRTFTRTGMVILGSIAIIEREFGKFDKAIYQATSVTLDLTERQFKEMSEMALDASVKWNKAAADTAQAFYFLGSAGLTAAEQMQTFNDTIMLSRAMGSDLATTVEGLVDIVRAFGLEFADSTEIVDQLTKTVVTSNQMFADLDKALSYASSTARLTNNTLAETAAMLGIMANAGIKGSMAGTVLRRAMTNLMSPTAGMSALMYELGLRVYDATGQMKPFIDIIGQISDKLVGTSSAYRNMVFEVLFGRRAIAGQITLFNYGSVALRKYANEIRDSGGTAKQVADKQMKAFTEILGQLWREIQRVSIILGGLLAPAILRVSKYLQSGVKDFREYVQANADAIKNTMKWATAISAVLVLGPSLLLLVSALIAGMVALASVITSPFIALIGTLLLLHSVWKSTFEPDGELSKSLDKFTGVLKKWLTDTFGVFAQALIWIGEKTVDGWNQIFGLISNMGVKAGDETIDKVKANVGDVVGAAVDVVKPLMDSVIEQLKDFAKAAGVLIPKELMDAFDTLIELFNIFMRAPTTFGLKVPKISIPKEFAEYMDNIKRLARETQIIIEASKKSVSWLMEQWAIAVNEFFDMFEPEVRQWADSFMDAMADARSAWASTIEDFLNDTATTARTIENLLEGMFQGILRAFNRMIVEIAANDLLFALFGGKREMKAGMPSFLFGATSLLRQLFPKGGEMLPEPMGPPAPEWWMDPFDPGRQSPYKPPEMPLGKMAPGVEINITNQGVPVDLRVTGQRFDGKRWVISAVMDEINTNPAFAKSVRGG